MKCVRTGEEAAHPWDNVEQVPCGSCRSKYVSPYISKYEFTLFCPYWTLVAGPKVRSTTTDRHWLDTLNLLCLVCSYCLSNVASPILEVRSDQVFYVLRTFQGKIVRHLRYTVSPHFLVNTGS